MKKRILALLMAAILAVGGLAGCGGKDDNETPSTSNPESQGGTTTGKLAYQASYYPVNIADEYSINYIRSYYLMGDYLFFAAEYYTGNIINEYEPAFGEDYSYEETVTGLFRLDINTQEFVKLDGYEPYAIPEGMEGNSYIYSITAGADNSFWIGESYYTYYYDLPEDYDPETGDPYTYYTPGENGMRMTQYDADGNLLQTVSPQVGEDTYIGNFFTDTNGYLYCSDWENIYLYDGEGSLLATIPCEDGGDLFSFSNSQVAVRSWTDEGKTMMRLIDPETQTLGEAVELSYNAYDLMPGNDDYQYFFNYNGVIYGHRDGAAEDEKIFSFLDCDINSSNISFSSIREDGTVVALEQERNDYTDSRKYNLIFMEQVDASTLPQKQELTLACMYLDYNLRARIIDFNRASTDTRITVNDYSEYNSENDWNAGMTKLNTEILSGMVPDILLVDSSMPIQQYAAKGILVDLWQLIDSDPELSRDDLMTHYFDALSIDGKLYQAIDVFSIQTAVGMTSVVGDRTSWTLDELRETFAALDPDATIFGVWDTKAGILEGCVSRSINSFVDWSNPVSPCSFDSEEFIDMLEFANSFPAEFNDMDFDWESYDSEYTRLRTGKQLLTTAYISCLDDIQYINANLWNEGVSFIGYPSSNGNGSCFSMPYNSMAISTACKNVDAAWSFVRTVLTEEYQTENYYMYQFPTNRHVFETMVEEAMTPEYTTDPDTGEQVEVTDSWWIDDDTTIEIGALTEAEYDQFLQLYESCNTVYSYDEAIMALINEEVAAYFDGQKTAEETARLIQDRVGLYVMEQG